MSISLPLSIWHNRRIEPGTDWAQKIDEQLNRASVILLLVSSDFLASDYCYGVEMLRALERHKAGTASVIPIILRPADWQETSLGTLQVLPPGGKPITSWDNLDRAFELVAKGIRRIVKASRLLVLIATPSLDQPFVERLSGDLKASGILAWFYSLESERDRPVSQEETIRNTMQTISTILLIVSPDAYHSRFLKEQLELAAIYQLMVIVLRFAGSGQYQPPPEEWRGSVCIDVRPEHYDSACQEVLFHLKYHPFILPPHSGLGKDHQPRNPYKGLRAFSSRDVSDFFGRETLIKDCLETLKQILLTDRPGQPQQRLLAVTGPSGSGKSSVVMAGLLPRLQAGELLESDTWIYVGSIVPGTDPIEALTIALSDYFPEKGLETIRADLEKDSARGLHQYATVLARRQESTRTLVLFVVDQFEELFTQTANEKLRRHFLDLLITATTAPNGPLMLILTLRTDFDDRVMQYADFYRLIDAHHCAVLPMEIADLQRVIEQPAMLPDVQLHFEENLVSDLLLEVRGQAGALPLLQFTLTQLFERRDGLWMTRKTFRELLTHTSGIRSSQDLATGYDDLRTLIAQGINLSDKVSHYQNHNFALFRILIPYLNGFDDTGVTDISTATSRRYLEYMNSVYGSNFQVTCDPNASVETHILSYPYPAGSSQGIDWGDWTAICGGGGLQFSVNETGVFLTQLNSDVFLPAEGVQQMYDNLLGWDYFFANTRHGKCVTKNGVLFSGSAFLSTLLVYCPTTGLGFVGLANSRLGSATTANNGFPGSWDDIVQNAYNAAWKPQS